MTPLIPVEKQCTFAHVSDLHIGQRGAVEAARRLVAGLLRSRVRVVILTGDITESGAQSEYDDARAVLQPLVDAGVVLLVCPGNHDVGWRGVRYERDARERFHGFGRDLCYLDVPGGAWPLVHEHAGARFICLDSTVPPGLLARGRIGYLQRQALARELEAAQRNGLGTIVALHHHPFVHASTLVLEDAAELLATLSARCDVLLFGHEHVAAEWSEIHGVRRILASCKSTDTLRFRLVELGADRISQRWVSV